MANLGANNVSSLSFSVENPDLLKNQARAEAIKQAREKAQAIASAGGFSVGRLISESENTYNPRQYYANDMAMGAAPMMKSTAPEVAPGSEDLNVTVTLQYEIR